jgi:MFS transporter, DHA1 family, tetracycline resistance protein
MGGEPTSAPHVPALGEAGLPGGVGLRARSAEAEDGFLQDAIEALRQDLRGLGPVAAQTLVLALERVELAAEIVHLLEEPRRGPLRGVEALAQAIVLLEDDGKRGKDAGGFLDPVADAEARVAELEIVHALSLAHDVDGKLSITPICGGSVGASAAPRLRGVLASSAMTAPAIQAPPRPAALVFIFITVMLDMLALGMIVPVLPPLVVSFLGGDTARAAGIYGLFGTVWALMQFLASPVLGALSDRFGRRAVILLSNLGLGLDYVLMALAPNLVWLFVGRVLSGITAASVSSAGAYIADVTPPERRAGGFGLIGAAFGIGFVLGPAVGGLLGGMDPRLPFWVAAGLSLLNFLYGVFVLPESLPRERRAPFVWRSASPVGALAFLRADQVLLGLAVVVFLGRVAHDVLPSTFVLYAGYRYGWDERTMGLFLAGVGVSTMIVSGALVHPSVRRCGERRALLLGLACGAAGFALYGLAPTGAVAVLAVPIQALWGLSGPAAQALMTRRAAPSEQGRLQGAISSLTGVAGLIGPGLFTLTFAYFIAGPGLLPGAPLLLAALLLVAAIVLAWRVTSAPHPALSPEGRG